MALYLGGAWTAQLENAHKWDERSSSKTMGNVAEGIVERYVAKGNASGRICEPYSDDKDVLERLGLVPNGLLANAAAVLFCSSAPHVKLTMGVLAGNDKVNILDLQHEDGPVFNLIDRAEYYVFANIRRRLVIGNGVTREEIPEIPREAVREAVINAFCHRDYTSGGAVEVNIYTDTVEVVNPGLFPEGDSPELHIRGLAKATKPRNALIAQTLFRAGIIEQYGSGIPRIKKACDEAGVKFEYLQQGGSTALVFHRPGSLLEETQLPAQLPAEVLTEHYADGERVQSLSDSARRVYKELVKRGFITSKEAAEFLGVGQRQARRVLGELCAAGLVIKQGETNGSVWLIVK